jgi:putative membrane protein
LNLARAEYRGNTKERQGTAKADGELLRIDTNKSALLPGAAHSDLFGFHRNHFDRLVHSLFGFLLAYPMRGVLIRVAKTRGACIGMLIVAAINWRYRRDFGSEFLESLTARIASPLGEVKLRLYMDQPREAGDSS